MTGITRDEDDKSYKEVDNDDAQCNLSGRQLLVRALFFKLSSSTIKVNDTQVTLSSHNHKLPLVVGRLHAID